ncbi:MAG: enoyl-CoA hydratase/isomerase family protein [Gammaproteobacteria bacterium]|nr:enoyl-CoA hydratase/isomerase family protein [Gammaproteobacteria bacterium]MBU1725280.1 enoyl-CoA hydratase/isomerase family protein [Gammaproteobacteria bacterium]MBU2006784.1 enoyl-CoA hydratase/isomerase family protein [Gammaproteobacteria bacterium]
MSGFQHLHLETDESNVVWLKLDIQGESTNLLNPAVLEELARACAAIHASKPRGLIVCSAKPGSFIAGIDFRLISQIETTEQALALIHAGQNVCQQFENLPCPTLAMIDGPCLGAGLELALTLDYRIASDNPITRLGLPEIRLGFHPCFGGTVRSTAKIGVLDAMDIMLKGKLLRPQTALKMGLIDTCVPAHELRATAIQTLLKPPTKAKPALHVVALSKLSPSRKLVGAKLRQQVGEHTRPDHYPAPYALIDLWEKHGGHPAEMYQAEAISAAKLMLGETAQNLVRVFFLQCRLKALGDKTLFQPRHVHIISDSDSDAGKDIATWCTRQGLTTSEQDASSLDKENLAKADVIIEATSENLQARQQRFAGLEKLAKPDAILATNTTRMPLEDLAGTMHQPKRLVGLHFCTPVISTPLVEVVFDPHNMDGNVVTQAKAFVRRIDKLPLPVKSSPGFLLNRILMPYVLEGIRLQQQGVPAAVIDAAARDFGMPQGPLELADAMGLDTCQQTGEILAKKLGMEIPLALYHMTRAGKLGRKSGEGFYRYRNGKMMKEEKAEWQGNRAMLQTRLIKPMVRESRACLEQGIVEDADLLDAGLIFGAGFAPFRGGPLHYAQANQP